jgi:potassium efflux system protein
LLARALLFLVVAATGFCVANLSFAQETSRPFSKIVTEWNRTLDNARRYVDDPVHFEERNREFRSHLAGVRGVAQAAADVATAEVAQLRKLVDALGPLPKDGALSEKPEIARQRAKYEEDIAFYRARVAQAEVALARVKSLSAAISELSRAELLTELFRVNPLPFAPETVSRAIPDLYRVAKSVLRTPVIWWAGLSEDMRSSMIFLRLPLFLFVAFLVGWGVRYLAVKYLGRDTSIEEPTYARRLLGAIAEGVSRGIFPALILTTVLLRITSDDAVITGPFATVLAALCQALILFILAWALPRAALAPDFPSWRLTVLTPEGARTLSQRITILAAIVSTNAFFDGAMTALATGQQLAQEAEALYRFSFHTVIAAGLLAMLQPRLWRVDKEAARKRGEEDEVSSDIPTARSRFWLAIHGLFTLLAISAFAASAIGYGQLGAYLIHSLILTGLIGGGLYLARGLFRETIAVVLRSALISRKLAIQHSSRRVAKFWLRALLDIMIAIAAVFLIAPAWGVPAADLSLGARELLQGFTVGNVTISLLDFAIAVLIFIVVVVLTRAGQRGLADRILPETQIDVGLQHSLSAGFGYIGVVIAAMLAVSAIGLDLTNIALIAGALSVGIGFGLQNIVNNFVSGLTLLVERPIKVGDWVVVGDQEGIVKRIQVRATEIETFQRTSVIVPNSAFLQEPVINRTHKDSFGRIEVPVGVAYGSDTAKVERILLGAAKENPKVAAWPEPFVLFQDFGASSLDFELRCYCPNVFDTFRAGSELRFAIDRVFRKEGIEIPFPQRDVHLKDIDRLENILKPNKDPGSI